MSDKRFAILLLTLAIGRLVAVPDAAKAQFCVIEDASIVQQKTAINITSVQRNSLNG